VRGDLDGDNDGMGVSGVSEGASEESVVSEEFEGLRVDDTDGTVDEGDDVGSEVMNGDVEGEMNGTGVGV